MYCRQCGSQLPLATPYCDVCGSKAADPRPVKPLLDEEDYITKIVPYSPTETAPTPHPRRKKRLSSRSVLVVALTVLILVSGVAIGFYRPFDEQTNSSNSTIAPSTSAVTPSISVKPLPERIGFAKGQSSKIVRSRLNDGYKEFVFGGRAGQLATMSLAPTDGSVSFSVEDLQTGRTLEMQSGRELVSSLPSTGDYRTTVMGKSQDVLLFLELVEETPTPSPMLQPTPEPTVYISTKPPPRDLIAGWMQIEPLQYRYFQFTIEPSDYQGKVVGRFTAWGGSNDINVVLIPAREFADFQNHNSYRQFYNSGYIHEGRVNATLPPGDYVLVINNRSALLTSKRVEAYFELRYE